MGPTLLWVFFATIFAFAQAVPRWCAPDADKMAKCQWMKQSLPNKIDCVQGSGDMDCCKKIANNMADTGVFRGPEIFNAGKLYGLHAFMNERMRRYKGPRVGYYAIALVKANSTVSSINQLKEKMSCHTGVQKNAGWVVPVGTLLYKGLMKWVDCNQYASVANFFSASCAPGSRDQKYNPKRSGVTKLCSLCSGHGNDNCARSSAEPYYSHNGALKCLSDGRGDVAFFKASVLGQIPPGEINQYRLLCLNGSQAHIYLSDGCYLAKAPARALLARKDANLDEYQALVRSFASALGPSLFDKKIFSDDAVGLEIVSPGFQRYNEYLDVTYYKAFAALGNCSQASESAAMAPMFNWIQYMFLLSSCVVTMLG